MSQMHLPIQIMSLGDHILSNQFLTLVSFGSQDCLSCKNLDPIVTTVTQILRKCYPKEPLPVVSVKSSYSFPLPGNVKTESPCVGFEGKLLKGEFGRRKWSMM